MSANRRIPGGLPLAAMIVAFMWAMHGAALGLIPLLGPFVAGRLFMNAQVVKKPPILVAAMMTMGVTLGQYGSAYLLEDFFDMQMLAVAQIFLFALTCVFTWLDHCYVSWKSCRTAQ